MNLFQICEEILNSRSDVFSIGDLLTLAFTVFGDERVSNSTNPLSCNTPYTPINFQGNPTGEIVKAFIDSKMESCEACGRCSTRMLTVLPDGNYNCNTFIVSDYPDEVDDRSGIPLSGPFEVKSGQCGECKNIKTCYTGLHETGKFPIPCEFSAGKETIGNSVIITPGKVLSDTLILKNKTDPANFLSVRNSWKPFLDKEAPEDLRETWLSVVSKIYVTYLVKCYGEEVTKEEIEKCLPWLFLERKLSNAPVTLFLGELAYSACKSDIPFLDAINMVQETDPMWGKILVFHHPRDIIKYKKDSIKAYNDKLIELEKRLKYYKKNSNITYNNEGEDVE